MGTISGTTHVMIIFSFWPGIGKHFTGNIFYSSDHSVTQLIHIFYMFMTNNVFYKPPEEKNMEELIWESVSLFPSNDHKTP
jgi:hypothetical protein